MIKQRRHSRILSILHRDGMVELTDLVRLMPEVSKVTLRRDMAELAEAGALKRTHGGAVRTDADVMQATPAQQPTTEQDIHGSFDDLDAIILPPIPGRGGDALRRKAVQSGIPFIAESGRQAGGTYLGPDNRQAAYDLGRYAGSRTKGSTASLLLVGHADLVNTRERCAGFEAGFAEGFTGEISVLRVNGQGNYKPALRTTLDALRANDRISVVFGVNDHSALAAMDAAERLDRGIEVYAAGGESANFVALLKKGSALSAVAAFFPEVVGARAIDLVMESLLGSTLPTTVTTPHALITAENLRDYFEKTDDGWRLRPSKADELTARDGAQPRTRRSARVGFMPHFPAHDWYRVMIQTMRVRCRNYGIDLVLSPPHKGIAAELSRLRREVAMAAAARISPGETVIVGEGEATLHLADELRRIAFNDGERLRGVTVITNALDVLYKLGDAPELKTILTSGEYQAADRCLVGPSLGALFERMRADLAFLSVAGVTPEFGLSSADERRALANSRIANAARRTIALADHTLIGADANHRVVPPGHFHEVITDDGALPADRQKLRAVGVDVLIAGEGEDDIPRHAATAS